MKLIKLKEQVVKKAYHKGVYEMNRKGERIGRVLHAILKRKLSKIIVAVLVAICGTIGFLLILGKTSFIGKKK
jgi:DNA replication initiation complex subunit (GINS family)